MRLFKRMLTRFKCTAGEDEEKDKQILEEFKEYMESIPEDDQEAVVKCGMQMAQMAMEQVGDEISDECKEAIKKLQAEMKEKKEDS
ncbi:hypothetical protein NPIL_581361 [Nephila pilipes]|uniref:Uncharacterized protein n=1 Tax=Nephila pilipes TaxID=299642 RepID=A0A8X6QBF6_NEPPI|nr:hypothetical protein NPIL_581361 [Nephila pilipes]